MREVEDDATAHLLFQKQKPEYFQNWTMTKIKLMTASYYGAFDGVKGNITCSNGHIISMKLPP